MLCSSLACIYQHVASFYRYFNTLHASLLFDFFLSFPFVCFYVGWKFPTQKEKIQQNDYFTFQKRYVVEDTILLCSQSIWIYFDGSIFTWIIVRLSNLTVMSHKHAHKARVVTNVVKCVVVFLFMKRKIISGEKYYSSRVYLNIWLGMHFIH